jgi:multidrug efflux pump subunit AcrB
MLTFFIKRPRFAMVIALVITLLGAIALKIIPVEQYPQITPPVVNVSASWPGASSADVAEAIATPLETQLNGVDHMLYMESTSSDEGTYSLNITFAAGTSPPSTCKTAWRRPWRSCPPRRSKTACRCASAPPT